MSESLVFSFVVFSLFLSFTSLLFGFCYTLDLILQHFLETNSATFKVVTILATVSGES